MPLRDLTRDSVLKALAEFDELGREPFLRQYGFSRSLEYFIIHGGQR
ncbi:hypothetical protein SAMN05444354_1192 [Stigmatella aurantiaca]|uniref:ScoMcrA-like N-terminal head domain-containing protein n=1 Tax=Stigmatella aurantiaca TaxID=41 RepID=A0A1H7ZK47_STIAU|nr:hypothetical protein SAMN05444354_1192 [Stigmatella aurantiaca]